MRLLNRTNQTLSAFLALVIVFLVMSITIYAWFSLTFSADGDLKFSTGAQDSPLALYVGRVEHGKDESTRSFVECTPGKLIPDPNEVINRFPNPFGMTKFEPGDESNPAGTTVKITEDGDIEFTEITIGLVDNLGEPKPENIIYLCLAIHAKDGDHLNFALSYLEEEDTVTHMNLYTMTEQTTGDGTGTGTYNIVKQDNTAIKDIEVYEETPGTVVTNSLLEYQYAIYVPTDAKYTPAHEDGNLSSLEFRDSEGNDLGIGMFDHNYSDTDTSTPHVPKGKYISSGKIDGVDVKNESQIYYLYIKITPNLEAFALAFDHLPAGTCFMDFNIRARFEATDVADGSGDGNTGN